MTRFRDFEHYREWVIGNSDPLEPGTNAYTYARYELGHGMEDFQQRQMVVDPPTPQPTGEMPPVLFQRTGTGLREILRRPVDELENIRTGPTPIPYEMPENVRRAAITLTEYFMDRNIRDWQLMGCCDRRYAERVGEFQRHNAQLADEVAHFRQRDLPNGMQTQPNHEWVINPAWQNETAGQYTPAPNNPTNARAMEAAFGPADRLNPETPGPMPQMPAQAFEQNMERMRAERNALDQMAVDHGYPVASEQPTTYPAHNTYGTDFDGIGAPIDPNEPPF